MLNGFREHHGPSIATPASHHDRNPRLQSLVNGGVELRNRFIYSRDVVVRYVFDQRHALAASPSVLARLEEGVSLLIQRELFGGYVMRRKEPTPYRKAVTLRMGL